MNNVSINYERDVSHCEVSPYIKEVTINSVTPANNSDNLECIKFDEMGWQVVSQKGLRKVGDKVMFIPAESVLPIELADLLEITKYLSRGRVRSTRLRGNRSEGVIVERDMIEQYIPYIMKWEDLPSSEMQGEQMAAYDISPYFNRFYKMPNILNEPNTFEIGEQLFYSEKIHGTNWRVGKLPHPHTNEMTLYIGGHNVIFKDTVQNVYLRAGKEIADKLPENIVFYGEIFGRGIQDAQMTYGAILGYRVFAATRNGEYISIIELQTICAKHGIPCVKFNTCVYTGSEQLRDLSEGTSAYADHIKEGCVFVSQDNPDRMAKCLSSTYLEKKNRKERH